MKNFVFFKSLLLILILALLSCELDFMGESLVDDIKRDLKIKELTNEWENLLYTLERSLPQDVFNIIKTRIQKIREIVNNFSLRIRDKDKIIEGLKRELELLKEGDIEKIKKEYEEKLKDILGDLDKIIDDFDKEMEKDKEEEKDREDDINEHYNSLKDIPTWDKLLNYAKKKNYLIKQNSTYLFLKDLRINQILYAAYNEIKEEILEKFKKANILKNVNDIRLDRLFRYMIKQVVENEDNNEVYKEMHTYPWFKDRFKNEFMNKYKNHKIIRENIRSYSSEQIIKFLYSHLEESFKEIFSLNMYH